MIIMIKSVWVLIFTVLLVVDVSHHHCSYSFSIKIASYNISIKNPKSETT